MMSYKEELLRYIETYEVNTPIFIEEIKEYFNRLISDDTEYKKVIQKKYIKSNGKIYGYYISDFIVSNICKKGTSYYNKTLGVRIIKPRIEINKENYRYLELLDKIKYEGISNKEINNIISLCNLDIKELFRYAYIVRSKFDVKKLVKEVCDVW